MKNKDNKEDKNNNNKTTINKYNCMQKTEKQGDDECEKRPLSPLSCRTVDDDDISVLDLLRG